jgi:hypothetical protein
MLAKNKYINPFTDFGFKKLFGSEFNKELLIDFLNQVLGEREHIYELTYLNTEAQGRTSTDRKAVFDLQWERGALYYRAPECQTAVFQGPKHLLRLPTLTGTGPQR